MKCFGLRRPYHSLIILMMLGVAGTTGFGETYPGSPAPDEISSWKTQADAGDGHAAFQLAMCYQQGNGVKVDLEKAKALLQKAADAGFPEANRRLGEMYREAGGGVARDLAQAVKWYEQAAGTGETLSMLALGDMAAAGVGMDRDPVQAALWRQRARERAAAQAAAEDAKGMGYLGLMEVEGIGGPIDILDGVRLLRAAADKSDPAAMIALSKAYANGIWLAPDDAQAKAWAQKALPEDEAFLQLAALYRRDVTGHKDPRESRRYLQLAMDHGNTQALETLAEMEALGEGGPPDHELALAHFIMAQEKGRTDKFGSIATIYSHVREGLPANPELAKIWADQAVANRVATGMTAMGALYEEGIGVDQNEAKAEEWYRKGADAGDPEGWTRLSALILAGPDGRSRRPEAYGDLKNGAEAGSITAMVTLAGDMLAGDLFAKDLVQARSWLERAREQGSAKAPLMLSHLLMETESGAGAQIVEAAELGATRGDSRAAFEVAQLYTQGIFVKQNYPRARHWFRVAERAGFAQAAGILGEMDLQGVGGPVNAAAAVEHFIRGAEAKDLPSIVALANCYATGNGATKDLHRAFLTFTTGAELGSPECMTRLADLAYAGEGQSRDYAAAIRWYLKAANKGERNAMFMVGKMYLNGEGIFRDPPEAFTWMQRASELGVSRAMTALAGMYEKGVGTRADAGKAEKWYRAAAEAGEPAAQAWLAKQAAATAP